MKTKTTLSAANLTPPSSLSKPAQALWRDLVISYAINDIPGRLLIESALSSWDRVQQSQTQLKKDGLVIRDRYGGTQAHPLLAVERASRTSMLRALAALRLDIELPTGTPGRPPGR